ncbi:MAG: thiamine phosphate synthase [Candidatus Magnetoovum sp. WYHC-5]|nr:thiamine phosphate synthase [Candidatus Magnetoovum sp. WYHC-5]
MHKELYNKGLCVLMETNVRGKSAIDLAVELIKAGVSWIQLRDKECERGRFFKVARILSTITKANGVKLIINDHADIALMVDADGVHLGQSDLPLVHAKKLMGNKIVGISTHSMEQAVEAEKNGADYIGFGPVFHTKTKNAGTPQGVSAIGMVKKAVQIPVIAIGGIAPEHVEHVFSQGADAAAVSAGIMKKKDVYEAACKYMEIINGCKR